MAKLSREELDRIVARDMPGFRVSRQSKVEREAETYGDARTAASGGRGKESRESALSRKYLGIEADDDDAPNYNPASLAARGANPGGEADNDDGPDDEEEIVAVEPESASHPWDRGARPKAVVIKNKKIIGMQG